MLGGEVAGALSAHLGHAALAHHRAAHLRVGHHDLVLDSVLARRHHGALVHVRSLLVVDAVLGDHRQVRVLALGRVRRDFLVRLQLVRLLKNVLTILHHDVLLVLVGELARSCSLVFLGSLSVFVGNGGATWLIVHVHLINVGLTFLGNDTTILKYQLIVWLHLVGRGISGLSHLAINDLLWSILLPVTLRRIPVVPSLSNGNARCPIWHAGTPRRLRFPSA